MKLLLFSDVHCSEPAVERLLKKSEQADVLVGAGDFGTMRRGTGATLAPFQSVQKPQVYVCGNGESDDELRQAVTWDHGHVLHGASVTIEDMTFFGLGGGIPVTPFGSWSFDLSEEDAEAMLRECPEQSTLVVHSPPFGTLDVSSRGHHLGSESIRDTIVQRKPPLVVCGHIHDCAGRWERFEDSWVVNAGPEGVLWDTASQQPVTPE